jgi:hypothetical protein
MLTNAEAYHVNALGEIKVCFYRKEVIPGNRDAYTKLESRAGTPYDSRNRSRRGNRRMPQNRLNTLSGIERLSERNLKGRALSIRTKYG